MQISQRFEVVEDEPAVFEVQHRRQWLVEVVHNHAQRLAVVLLRLHQLLDAVVSLLNGLQQQRPQSFLSLSA